MNQKIHLPDVGDLDGVEVVEIFVKPGDYLEKEQTILTLEGSKASMEIPSPQAGVVKEILVKVGDVATESMELIIISDDSSQSALLDETKNSNNENVSEGAKSEKEISNNESTSQSSVQNETTSEKLTFNLPDVGDLDGVEVVEIFVKAGDRVSKEQTLITLEGSKASMEIPSPFDGIIDEIMVKVGDGATDGMPIAVFSLSGTGSNQPKSQESATNTPLTPSSSSQVSDSESKSIPITTSQLPQKSSSVGSQSSNTAHASPSVRKFARTLGVDLFQVKASGSKNRISKEDIEQFVKAKMQASAQSGVSTTASTGSGLPSLPKVDFEKFGEVEYKKLNKIKMISSSHLHASWVNIPHVTQYADVNAESLESYRQAKKGEIEKQGYKLTPLVLIMKAVVASLKEFPHFNSSLVDGQFVLKKYYNIGIAVDTADGLVVPVVRNVDEKSVYALAKELSEISQKARDKKLNVTDMSGGTFTISNLGGVGAAKFTPIINAPEVAILGLSRSFIKPVFSSGYFMPQLTMPLSLSYDHRVIDGADGARFMNSLAGHFLDIAGVV